MEYIKQKIAKIEEELYLLKGYIQAKTTMKPKFQIVKFPEQKEQPRAHTQGAEIIGKNGGLELPPDIERGVVNFTQEEISTMPKNYQKLFKTNKLVAHIRRKNGKYYEIRVMIDGTTYTASSTSLDRAKEKFVEKLKTTKKEKKPLSPTFKTFAEEWLENVSKPFVKEITYDGYATLLYNHILPALGELRLKDIDSITIQKFLNEKGSSRTTEKCFTLLSTIFSYAAPKHIPFSPMRYVKKPIYIPETRVALSKEEEFAFVEKLFKTNSPYRYAFVLIMYCGLRRSELKSADVGGKFVTVRCAKQRLGRPEKTRSIPISPILRKFFPLGEIPTVRDDTLSAVFSELCPNHTLHDLRKTFNTRGRTCGIPKTLMEFWMGHKPDKNDVNEAHYMCYDEAYQLEQIKKFDYEFPDVFT